MTGDTDWTLRTSYSDVTLLGDSSSSSQINFRSTDMVETIRTTSFDYTHLVGSLWQVGINVPIVEKIRKLGSDWESQTGVGDIKLVLAYEFHPIYSRTTWPRGFAYTGVTLPTAPSIFTSKRLDLLDARGTGHYYYLLGGLFEKRYSGYLLALQPQLSYRPGRSFNDDNITGEKIETEDSLDHLINLSASKDWSESFNSSISVTRNYSERKSISNFIGASRPSLVHDVSLGLSFPLSKNSTLTASYTDQFLIRDSYNHTLGRSFGIGYNLANSL